MMCYSLYLTKKGLVVIGHFNGHVVMERADLERWHGGHSYGILNDEGRAVLQCTQMYDLAICNTFFQKKDEHMITYRSGTRQSTPPVDPRNGARKAQENKEKIERKEH